MRFGPCSFVGLNSLDQNRIAGTGKLLPAIAVTHLHSIHLKNRSSGDLTVGARGSTQLAVCDSKLRAGLLVKLALFRQTAL